MYISNFVSLVERIVITVLLYKLLHNLMSPSKLLSGFVVNTIALYAIIGYIYFGYIIYSNFDLYEIFGDLIFNIETLLEWW